MESLGNDDVSSPNSRKYELVGDDVKQKMPEGSAWVDFVTFTAPLFFYLCAFRLFCDILWSSCFEAIKKNAIYISLSHFVLLNKRHKLWPRKRKYRVWPKLWTERHSVNVDLRFERRITVYKHWRVCQTHVYHSQIFFNWISSPSLHETHPDAIDTSRSLIGNDFTDIPKSL